MPCSCVCRSRKKLISVRWSASPAPRYSGKPQPVTFAPAARSNMPSVLGDLPVRLALPATGVVRDGLAPLADGRRRLGRPNRHVRVGRVGDAQQQALQLGLDAREGARRPLDAACRARPTLRLQLVRALAPPAFIAAPTSALTCLRSARSGFDVAQACADAPRRGPGARRRAQGLRPCRGRRCGSRRRRRAAAGVRRSRAREPPSAAAIDERSIERRQQPAGARAVGSIKERPIHSRERLACLDARPAWQCRR